MTTPAQSQAKVFNPSVFQNPDEIQVDQNSAQQSQNEQKEYPVTGVAARDSVRKMLFELYQGDSEDNSDDAGLPLKYTVAQVVDQLENDIFQKLNTTPLRQQQQPLVEVVQRQDESSGPRFEQSRKDLRTGVVDAKTLIRDDYVQGKSAGIQQNQNLPLQQQQQQPAGLAPRMMPGGQMGAPGFRPPGPQGMRPRMMPGGVGGGQMFRPPGGMGFNRPPGAPIVQMQQQQQQQQIPTMNNMNQSPVQQKQTTPTHVQQSQHDDDNKSQKLNMSGDIKQNEIKLGNSPDLHHQQQNDQQQILVNQSDNMQSSRDRERELPLQMKNQKEQLPPQSQHINGSLQNKQPINIDQDENDQNNMSFEKEPSQQNKNDSNKIQQQNQKSSTTADQSSVDISQEKAIGIDDSIVSNEKKIAKKKKKVKKGEKSKKKATGTTNQDQQLLEELIEDNIKSAQQILPQGNDQNEINQSAQRSKQMSRQASVDHIINGHQEIKQNDQIEEVQQKQQEPGPQQQLSQNYQFLDQSSSVIIQDKDESILLGSSLQQNNLNDIDESHNLIKHQQSPLKIVGSDRRHNESDQLVPNSQNIENDQNNLSKHSTQEKASLLQQPPQVNSNIINKSDVNSPDDLLEERKTPLKHKSKQQSLLGDDEDDVQNLHQKHNSKNQSKQEKLVMSKNPSVKSLAHSSSNQTQQQQQQMQQQLNSANVFESDNVKRLQDALSYKRQQKKELSKQIVYLETDINLQQLKTTMLMEENKTIREELRSKDKDLKALKSTQNERVSQLELQNKKLENSLKDKQTEIDQLKREVQRQKDEKQTLKDRVHQINEESQHQRQQLDHLLKALESRLNHSNAITTSSTSSSVVASAAASGNQSDHVDQLQKEFRDMKAMYEQKIRDLNDDLTNKTKLLQRTERQNIQLQERNNQLQELLSQVEVQQLSTVAGSGSNQRDSTTALLNRRQGGGSAIDDSLNQHRAYEEEGTGGDGGYGQSSQSNVRNQNDYLFADEGGNAAVISGLSENFDNDSNQPIFDGGSTQRNQRNTQGYQLEPVSGGHPQFEDEHDQEEDLDDEEDYDEDDVDNAHDDYEDEEGNQYDGADNNTQGIASSSHTHSRDNQTLGGNHPHQSTSMQQTFQGDNNDGYAGGQQTLPPRQRKQGSRRRGNRQQNQQHTTGQSAITTQQQNPRQRNSRGRQQRSNQQQVNQQQQQQQQIGSQQFQQQQNAQQQQHLQQETQQHINAPSSAPSSQHRQQQQNATQEYFANYGDSSSVFMNAQNRDQSSSSAINIPHTQFGQRDISAAAGSGVVLTAGSRQQNAVDSMMSAESGSTATAFLDKNQFPPHHTGNPGSTTGNRGHNQPMGRQHQQMNQPSSLQSVQQNQIQYQTGSNNNQLPSNQSQVVPSDLFNDSNDNYTAAVGAPTSRAAAHPRQGNTQRQQQQQPSNQNQNAPSSSYGVYNFMEESKQSSGGGVSGDMHHQQPPFYQQNANQSSQSSMRQGNQGHSLNQYFVGGSGEQEEDSSSGYFAGAGNVPQQQQQMMQYHQSHGGAGGPGSAFDSTRRNQSSIQQMRQGRSNTQSQNDSKKTSGANTPNKDRADTPTTKAYRSQQQQNSYVHNLTSNQLFFSNQDEGDQQLFGGAGGAMSTQQVHNQQQQHFMHPQQQQNAQQQFGRDPDVINPNLFE